MHRYEYFLSPLLSAAMRQDVVVTLTNTLDDALEQTSLRPATIRFAAETDGTICTFAGNTFTHPQKLIGNGPSSTIIKSADGKISFFGGNAVSLSNMGFTSILYGGELDSDSSANTNFSLKNVDISANVFGGGRANSGFTVTQADSTLSVSDCSVLASKSVYGGGFANGGTVSLGDVSLSLKNVNFVGTGSVYGYGSAAGGGHLSGGDIATRIDGGTYNSIYNGANITTSGVSSAAIGDMRLEIVGGTFSGVVGNGSTPRKDCVTTQGVSVLDITDGVFEGVVAAGAMVFGTMSKDDTPVALEGTGGTATVSSSTITIKGGTFKDQVFGANAAQAATWGDNTFVTGDVLMTLDCSTADIYFEDNVYGGSMGKGTIGGDVTLVVTGSGGNLHFAEGSYISCESSVAWGTSVYVAGLKELIFDNFIGDFSANFKDPSFDIITVRNGSTVNMHGAGAYQQPESVRRWNLELDGPSPVITFVDPEVNQNNNFHTAIINVSFAGSARPTSGRDWTVFLGTSASTNNWNQLGGVTIDGVTATSDAEHAWTAGNYRLYRDASYAIKLARI